MTESQFPLNSRVKIYLLGPGGNWMDHSVGFFMLVKEDAQTFYMRVVQDPSCVNEVSADLKERLVQDALLNTSEHVWEINLRLHCHIRYEMQGENIISWAEPDANEEIALSFKETSYVKEVFQQIETFQGRRASNHFRFDEVEAHPVIQPSYQNLDTLQTQIQEHPEVFIQGLTTSNWPFFEHLKRIFEEAEDLQNEQTLEQLYHIFRCLIYLKNENILLLLMNDENYLITFGVLEYHMDRRQSVSYRQFLIEKCKFHSIFDEMDDYLVSSIKVNYRLMYLKETVMEYYLFQEDPTYLVINNVIKQNNYLIVNLLLGKHFEEFTALIERLPNEIERITSFLHEFYNVFTRVPQHFEFKQQLIDLSKQSNLLNIINIALRDVLASNSFTIESAQFMSQTLLQFVGLSMNIEIKNLIDYLLESNSNQSLFWGNMQSLVFSDQVATHPILCDILTTMFTQQPSNLIRPQLVQFLTRCRASAARSDSSFACFEQIVRNYAMQLPSLSEEYLQISSTILDHLRHKSKAYVITSMKHFRFLVRLDERDVTKFLKDRGYANQFMMFNITRPQEGVLEGLLRETVATIIKNNVTLAQHLVTHTSAEDPVRKSSLFSALFREFTYVSDQQSLPPPVSPSAKIHSQGSQEFRMVEDEEDLPAVAPSPEEMEERRNRLIKILSRKKEVKPEEPSFFEQRRSPPPPQFEILEKRVKPND